MSGSGVDATPAIVCEASRTSLAPVDRRSFPPSVAVHLVKLACELPDLIGVPVSQWDCVELARQLAADGIVESISSDTVRRILTHHRLKPWRKHMWLTPKVPRDASFRSLVSEICDLYTRPLDPDEVVFSGDEKTSLQPRHRRVPTQPAAPNQPIRVEHEYVRSGALNLIAAINTRTGQVYGRCYARKRAIEFIDFLNGLDAQVDSSIHTVHLILDNARIHKCKAVQAWLTDHPRFRVHFTPVHCSWMNQIEQWFGTLQRKRFGISNFDSLDDLDQKVHQFIDHYNTYAQPYNWTSKSVARVMAWVDRGIPTAA